MRRRPNPEIEALRRRAIAAEQELKRLVERDQHQGWSNFETFGVALEIDNDEPLYNSMHAVTRQIFRNAADRPRGGALTLRDHAVIGLADHLKERLEAFSERVETNFVDRFRIPFMTQLLNCAIGRVDYQELAEYYLDQMVEQDKWIWRQLEDADSKGKS